MNGLSAIAEFIEARTGLVFDGSQQRRIASAVEQGMRQHRCSRGYEYVRLLSAEESAWRWLLERITVGETYFFRDARQLSVLSDTILPAISADFGPSQSAWSAGCSTGEEAYTLAMVAAEMPGQFVLRVTGTDIAERSIDVARRALYRDWSLRNVGNDRRDRWFSRDGEHHRVDRSIRDRVRFEVGNLLEGSPGRFPLVFCRNVLMYMSGTARRRAAEVFRAALAPGGWLVTGVSDPPLGEVDGLHAMATPHGLVYRSGPAPPRRSTERNPPGRAAPKRTALPQAAPSAPNPPTPKATQPKPVAPIAAPARQMQALAAEGRVADALAAAARAQAAEPLDAELRYLTAVIHLDVGDEVAALASARAALYLDPHMAPAHLLIGQLEASRGRREAARRAFRTASELFAGRDPAEPVPLTDGKTAGELAALSAGLANREALRA